MINTLITIFSILFSIFGVTISVIAALIDTKLFKDLFAKESNSKNQLVNLNKAIITVFFINIIVLIFIKLFKPIIIKIEILSIISIESVIFLSTFSLFSLIGFYRIITKALFNIHN